MTASHIDYSNLFTQAKQNVIDFLDNRSYVADPVGSSAQKRKFVYDREPDHKNIGLQGFPFIICHTAITDFSDLKSTDRRKGFVNFTIEIEVVSADRGGNNAEGKGAQWCDQISDDIVQTFNDTTPLNTLRSNGLYNFRPNSTGRVEVPTASTLTFRRSFFLTFRTRIRLSAT